MDTELLVSVILPTYNRAHTLSRAVNSVLNQTYKNFELIIIDDCSTDNTEEVVKNIHDERIVYIRQSSNKGAAAARNTGIKIAKGDYVAFQDSDDEWMSEKLEKQMKVFESDANDFSVVYTDMLRISSDETIKYWSSPDLFCGKVINPLTNEYQVLNLGIQSVLIKKRCFDEIGLFDESFPRFIDLEFFIRLAKRYPFWHIREPLVKYYETEGISTNGLAYIKAEKLLLEKYAEATSSNKKFLANRYYKIGMAYVLINDSREAKQYFLKALSLNHSNIKSLVSLFLLLLSKNLYFKTLNFYRFLKKFLKNE